MATRGASINHVKANEMNKLISFGAWAAVLLWSLLCWAAFGLIDVASGLANGTSSIVTNVVPGTESLARGLIDLADDVGELLLFLTWIGVSVLILGGAWVAKRVIGGLGQPRLDQWTGAPQPPPYAAGNKTNAPVASVLDRLAQKGFGPKTVGTLKRQPGQDHWKA